MATETRPRLFNDRETAPVNRFQLPTEPLIWVGLLVNLITSGVASLTRLGDPTPSGDAIQMIAVGGGMLLVGVGIARAPSLALAWLFGSFAALFARLAIPDSWDSFRVLSSLLYLFLVLGAILAALPLIARLVTVSLLAIVHFGGILSAVTSPPPQPWLSQQAWVRVYRPYLQATYMNNAYHFYSPEPGPANQLWACIRYQTNDESKRYQWVKMPRRPANFKDPLGIGYYRRLALTEAPNIMQQPNLVATHEDNDVQRRRQLRADIPFHPGLLSSQQYLPPSGEVQRQILPSYARHLMSRAHPDGLEPESVKIYRVLHRILEPKELARGQDPYEPMTYVPYFQGEYNAEGKLIDSKDPLLFWCIPILARPKFGSVPLDGHIPRGTEMVLEDYVTKHAGFDHGGFP